MLLSIIIPVYNCGPVIIRCLDSIDYPEAEIIVIDDGSQDDTAQIVMNYISNHPNVRLIRKQNGGVSSARNAGIETATGKYIMFIDADDFIAPNGIDIVVNLAESTNADVVKYKVVSINNPSQNSADSLLDYSMAIETLQGRGIALNRYDISDFHVVDALFKRSLIIENDLRFHTDLTLREDDVFMGEFYCHAETIIITNLPLYQYVRYSPYSSTHKQDIKNQRSLIESAQLAIDYRSNYVKRFFPELLPLERLKYMRWVCDPKAAVSAGYSLSEYKLILNKFKDYCCWPLDYKWIHIAGLDNPYKARVKRVIKTYLCNHPTIGYLFYKLYQH